MLSKYEIVVTYRGECNLREHGEGSGKMAMTSFIWILITKVCTDCKNSSCTLNVPFFVQIPLTML